MVLIFGADIMLPALVLMLVRYQLWCPCWYVSDTNSEMLIKNVIHLFICGLVVLVGNHGVVREGLTSPWIPDGWSWGGVVSDHCPIWAEYFVDKDLDTGPIVRDLEGITLTAPPVAIPFQ